MPGMKIEDIATPRPRTAYRDEPLLEAARALCDQHVGALIVLERGAPISRPVGILTDRDIVCGEWRRAADLHCLTVGDVMTPNPLVLRPDLGVTEAIAALTARAVRRAPLVDGSGALVGIVTLDDLLPAVAQELVALAQLMGGQAGREGRG